MESSSGTTTTTTTAIIVFDIVIFVFVISWGRGSCGRLGHVNLLLLLLLL